MSANENHGLWDRVAERYARTAVPNEAVYRRKLAMTQQYLTREMKVFEFGCGTGTTAIEHAPFVDAITAIDVSANMLSIAKKKAEDAGINNINFRQSTIEAYETTDQNVDCVLALSILHLVSDKEAVLKKVASLMKPGGVFVSSTACLGEKLWFFKYIAPIGRFVRLLPMLRVFKVKELVQCFVDAGFDIVEQWEPEKSNTVFIIAKKR
ncbi:MAG: methyltransferase domain-containing protein [Pseudomonadota bacterium]